ncbi:MAG: hypothetical protein QOG26_1393 [Solirubrobacterales bacterium]|nr:hypothetical protein [Solirubrobacterales bacterium]
MKRRGVVALAALCALALCLPAAASATTINVTTTVDEANNGNAACSLREAVSAANANAAVAGNACPAGDSVLGDEIKVPAGTYVLSGAAGDDLNASGDLDLDLAKGSVTVDGDGPDLTVVNGNDVDRIFDIKGDAAPASLASTTLDDLTITNGTVSGDGGGVRLGTDAGGTLTNIALTANVAAGSGGGVFAADSLVVTNAEVSGNTANTAATGSGRGGGIAKSSSGGLLVFNSVVSGNTASSSVLNGEGGGIFSASTSGAPFTIIQSSLVANNTASSSANTARGGGVALTDCGGACSGTGIIVASTVSGNQVNSTAGNGEGGGVFSDEKLDLNLTNSTVSGNTVTQSDVPASAFGGGVFFVGEAPKVAKLSHVTVAGNSTNRNANGGEAVTQVNSGALEIANSILQAPDPADVCSGDTDKGGNIDLGTSCGFAAGDSNQPPQLSPLQPNGAIGAFGIAGPLAARQIVPTQALAPTSPAVGHVPAADCKDTGGNLLTSDERGFPRPFPSGGDCDSGAYELNEVCLGMGTTLLGTTGADSLRGTAGADVIFAGAGNDSLNGLGGNDRLCAGAGNDKLAGGTGNDQLRGEAGKDTLKGNAGSDNLNGGSGRDGCNGGSGKDRASACESKSAIP